MTAHRRDPREVACATCGAPRDAPCADLRTYDRNLYGARVHRERARAARAPRPLFVDVPLPFESEAQPC